MCISCDWAPYFEAFGRKQTLSRRSVLRGGAAFTAAAAGGADLVRRQRLRRRGGSGL